MTVWINRDVQTFAAAYLRADRQQLATLARSKYRTEGRGLVAITVRGGPVSASVEPTAHMIRIGYWPLDRYQALTATAPAVMRPRIAETVTLIEDYDPRAEMVLAWVCGPQHLTLTLVTQLEAPAKVEEAGRVH